MKTILLEEIVTDPHLIKPLLAAGATVEIVEDGKTTGSLVPTPEAKGNKEFVPFSAIDYRARFLEMWGPDAFNSTRSVQDIIDYARREGSISDYQ